MLYLLLYLPILYLRYSPTLSTLPGPRKQCKIDSLFGDEAHLVPAVLVGVEQLEEFGALEDVHDVDLPLDVAAFIPRGALHELGREGIARVPMHALQHLSELPSGRIK